MGLNKILKNSLILTLVGGGICLGSLVGGVIQFRKAQSLVDDVYQNNPAYVQYLEDEKAEVWNKFMNGDFGSEEYDRKIVEIYSLDNKIAILKNNSEKITINKVEKILKKQKVATGFGVFGACLLTLGLIFDFTSFKSLRMGTLLENEREKMRQKEIYNKISVNYCEDSVTRAEVGRVMKQIKKSKEMER